MSLNNFLTLLYRSVVPVKPEPTKAEVKQTGGDVTLPVRYHSGEANSAPRHYHGQYGQFKSEEHALPLPASGYNSVGKYMTRAFNAICTQSDVQCTVTMDPSDFQQIYIFKNLGKRLVKVEWSKEIRFIEPGESAVIKARQFIDIHGFGTYSAPVFTSLNNGV